MVQVNREEVEEPITPSHRHGVAGVVYISPGISALGQTPISQQV